MAKAKRKGDSTTGKKPPNKKAKLETAATPGSDTLERLLKNPATSPASSTSSTTSSLKGEIPSVATPSSIASTIVGSTFPSYYLSDLRDASKFPRLSYILSQNKATGTSGAESLSSDDLDGLQGELESLLVASSVRIRSLQADAVKTASTPASVAAVLGEHFDPHHQEKMAAVASIMDSGHGTRTSVSAAAKLVMAGQLGALSPTPGPSTTSIVSNRKVKNLPTPAAAAVVVPVPPAITETPKLPKKKLKEPEKEKRRNGDKPARAGQNRTHSVSSEIGFDSAGKQEAPSQFWDFADTYCRDLTQEDVESLEKMIKEHSTVPDNIFEIPPLGPHFKDEDESSKTLRERKELKTKDRYGPLTHRLVSALVEEQVSGYNVPRNELFDPNEEGSVINHPELAQLLGFVGGNKQSTVPLETRIRNILIQSGFMLPTEEEDPMLNPEDEILCEIKRTQNLFKRVHNHNSEKLTELLATVKKEFDRGGAKRELEKADKEVLEAYRSLAACRLKKKPLTKEREAAEKALMSRRAALTKLHAI